MDRLITLDNLTIFIIITCIVIILFVWFLVKLLVFLYLGGKVLRRALFMVKANNTGDVLPDVTRTSFLRRKVTK